MVSLNRGDSSSTWGGIFNEYSVQSNDNDTNQLLHPVIGEEKVIKFTPLNTIPAAVFICLLAILMEVLVIVLALYWTDSNKCEPYFLTLYSHGIYWLFTYVMDFYFKRKHNESRIMGYLEFYQKTNGHSRIPFYITSIWNTILLFIETLFHQQYGNLEEKCGTNGFLTPINYMCLIITLENIFMIPVIVSYVYKVAQFNKHQLCPDVQRDEWMASFIQESYSAGEVGYRERENYVEDLLEKQADLLRYLKEQNSRLIEKVLSLSLKNLEVRSNQFT